MVIQIIMAAEFDLVFAINQCIGDIKGDGSISTGVAANLFVVYEAVEVLICCTNVQQNTANPEILRQGECFTVGQGTAFRKMLLDSGQKTFRTERNPDGFVKVLGKRIGTNTKFPVTV